MCDFMFYDSLYKNGKNKLLAGINTLEQDVRYFIEQASKYIKTQFGLSFAPEHVLLSSDYKNPKFKGVIHTLWKKRVPHFGFLDLYRQYTKDGVVAAALTVLRRCTFNCSRGPQSQRLLTTSSACLSTIQTTAKSSV